jgi:hypothetical protein
VRRERGHVLNMPTVGRREHDPSGTGANPAHLNRGGVECIVHLRTPDHQVERNIGCVLDDSLAVTTEHRRVRDQCVEHDRS